MSIDLVRDALEAAVPTGLPPGAPPSEFPADDGLPEDCPIVPLGVAGTLRWYLDELRQMIPLAPREHTPLNITALYGRRQDLLRQHWPKEDDHNNNVGWSAAKAAAALMDAAARRGPWTPDNRVRGLGAWPGEKDGEVILHCGDAVFADGDWRPCGVIGRYVYPAASAIPRPSDVFAPAGPNGPGRDLLDLFKQWAWRRPDIDPWLMVGCVGCQMMGGALPWRPTIWITGDRGWGKSALHGLISTIHDAGAIATADATEAGLRQVLKQSSLPILFDELEPGEEPHKVAAIVALARRASSGSVSLRGTAGHVEQRFVVRSVFLFSSILLPPLTGAERSRIAQLDLTPLGSRSVPSLQTARLRALGSALRRRLVDQWPRFPEVFAGYRGALMECGHDGRGADLYGVLLACANLVLFEREGFGEGELEDWAARLTAGSDENLDPAEFDHQLCLTHLLSAPVDAFRSGQRRTIGQWIAEGFSGSGNQPREANSILETYGVKIAYRDTDTCVRERGIYVATTHPGLSAIFDKTHWGGGGSKSGPWSQALRRCPGAEAPGAQRFAGTAIKTTWLPATAFEAAEQVTSG